MHWIAAALVIAIWSIGIVAGLVRTRWITAAVAGLVSVLATIVAAQAVGGRNPVFYGIMLVASLFLAAVMASMGVIAAAVKALAKREGG